ncbi:hypothetical protein RhiirA4_458627 [Rhizophagus irregularis]|uniref:Uncharacterized protein n=1 Tax=Rhizophagus irregularis TaxID=588596 RepID=A0A2I1GCM4_9GLOM|nr:hypothetical protein RhiirA4_458627 [Rhizophagus irregularis]
MLTRIKNFKFLLRDDRDNVRFTDITDIANINDIANITDITDIADIYCSQYRSERSGPRSIELQKCKKCTILKKYIYNILIII